MGFYELEGQTDSDTLDLPWLNEYLEMNPKTKDGLFYLVNTVKATPKGYILTTDNFNAWVWKKTKPSEALATGLTDSVQSDIYPQLAIKVILKNKNKFILGFLDDQSAKYVWNGEMGIYSLHPQKNLPLSTPPEDIAESKGNSRSGKHSQGS